MKKMLFIFTIALITSFATTVKAQSVCHPWIIGVSTNYADFNVINYPVADQFQDANWMGKHLPTMLRFGRMLNNSFTLTAVASSVTLEVDKLNRIPLEQNITSDFFWKVGGQLEYHLANGYLINEKSWFASYIFSGVSGSTIDDITYLSIPMGVGFNIWVSEYVGFNFQGSYDYIFDFNDYGHYSAGIIVRFGQPIDKDKDGIPNLYDACPEVPGVVAHDGCPDTDGDGITDSLDKCPDRFGPASADGCPDMDGDGIPDHLDRCPNEPGTLANRGCPDTDGDGIIDIEDHCPNQPGPAATQGCPDADGDGVPDEWDICPNEPGSKSNAGCPIEEKTTTIIIPIEKQEAIRMNQKNIEFDLNSANLRNSSIESLDNIIKIMNEYPLSRYTVYGYTDDTGPADFNFELSKKRAASVKEYFVKKGVAANRLDSAGFGEQNPLVPNSGEPNRKMNRRVEINSINE
jgi:outer membrane protein OmpA-like peptidoglycan-associated protein